MTELSEADRALARLDAAGGEFPDPHTMVGPFIRQEAVLSSRIEGTRTTLDELLTFEVSPTPKRGARSDAAEVESYVRALDYGIDRLGTLPISLRLLRELHERLMQGVRGGELAPGEFRRSQNWIGPPGSALDTATYVPPPVKQMHSALEQLELYVHNASDLPPLIRIAMIHYQFEAIHPFLDGNGRIGRLLVSLLLSQWQLLTRPFLYLSAHFEASRQEYYDRLLAVSQVNEWNGWLTYFLHGVAQQSRAATVRISRLAEIREHYHEILQGERAAANLSGVVEFLLGQPIVSVRQVERGIRANSYRVAQSYILKLVELGILREVTGQSRNRLYRADEILKAIKEPLA